MKTEIEVGGAVCVMGSWYEVEKLNTKSVRCRAQKRGQWGPKVMRSQVTATRTAAEVKEISANSLTAA